MLFENNDFISTLNTFGIDMSGFINSNEEKQNEQNNYNQFNSYRPMSHSNQKFLPAVEGFLRGNLMAHEYKPYKNMTYRPIQPKTDKEAKMFKVFEYDFAITDLNFYLDLNPNDKEAFELFKMYANELEKAKKEYERLYGPLCVEDTKGEVFDWIDNPWPWDRDGGSMYV